MLARQQQVSFNLKLVLLIIMTVVFFLSVIASAKADKRTERTLGAQRVATERWLEQETEKNKDCDLLQHYIDAHKDALRDNRIQKLNDAIKSKDSNGDEQAIRRVQTALGGVRDIAEFQVTKVFLEHLIRKKFEHHQIKVLYAVIIPQDENSLYLEKDAIINEVALEYCLFPGNVVLGNAKFNSHLSFEGSVFEGHYPFYADDLTVSGTLFLSYAFFKCPVDFDGAIIGKGLEAEYIHVRPLQKDIDNDKNDMYHYCVRLEDMKVGYNADLTRAEFAGSVDGSNMHISGDLVLEQTHFLAGGNGSAQTLINFQGLKVDGSALLLSAIIKQKIDFRDAKVGETLDIRKTAFPDHGVTISGMTYHDIKLSRPDDASKSLLGKIEHNGYDPDIYVTLIAALRRDGYLHEADEVFVVQKVQERQVLSGYAWWRNVCQWFFNRYGLIPYWFIPVGIIFVLFGAYVFRYDQLEWKSPDEGTSRRRVNRRHEHNSENELKDYCNGFLYSLDRFLPLIDLQVEAGWQPKPNTFARRYYRFHRGVGWIFLALAVVAAFFTG